MQQSTIPLPPPSDPPATHRTPLLQPLSGVCAVAAAKNWNQERIVLLGAVERLVRALGLDLRFHLEKESGRLLAELCGPKGPRTVAVPEDDILALAVALREAAQTGPTPAHPA